MSLQGLWPYWFVMDIYLGAERRRLRFSFHMTLQPDEAVARSRFWGACGLLEERTASGPVAQLVRAHA